MGAFLDLLTGGLGFSSGDTGLSQDGHILAKAGDNAALDLQTGELHLISSWGDDYNGLFNSGSNLFGGSDNDPFKLF